MPEIYFCTKKREIEINEKEAVASFPFLRASILMNLSLSHLWHFPVEFFSLVQAL